MSISASVKALLELRGYKQRDLIQPLGVKGENPVQSLSNKIRGERWSASDLVSVAEFTGCKLAFILPNGERVLISADPGQGTPEGESRVPDSGGVTLSNNSAEEKRA